MKNTLLKLSALLPIPIILALVTWTGRRPAPKLPIPKGAAAKQQAWEKLLPKELSDGWKRVGKVERFDKKTLFDRIDGAAPTYINAGFNFSLGAEYRGPKMKESIIVDAYQMGTMENALGIFAIERDRSYRFIKVGDDGYLASGSLNFWAGTFYVKLAGFEDGDAMDAALTKLAEMLAKALPGVKKKGAATLQAMRSWLPQEGRLPHSEGYSLAPLLDLKGLEGAYYADYGEAEQPLRLFGVSAADAAARLEKAAAQLAQRGDKLEKQDGELKQVLARGEQGTTLLMLKGSALVGAVELEDDKGVELARTILSKHLAGAKKP